MKFFETSKHYILNKPTYINLRWITIIGQFLTVNLVKYLIDFEFNYLLSNLIIIIGIFSNYYLIFTYIIYLFLNLVLQIEI